jgi:hypothetical protein
MIIYRIKSWLWESFDDDASDYIEWERWFKFRLEAMQRGEEVVPPWIMYPDCDFEGLGPMWGGWRQGSGEPWLLDIWFPFWKKLSDEEKDEYMRKWSPPSELWDEYLRNYWRK